MVTPGGRLHGKDMDWFHGPDGHGNWLAGGHTGHNKAADRAAGLTGPYI